MKGLICAGGSATRLAELTRVTNKHLLPVGSWPMVYYPLQLLQRVGVHEVLLVTGQQHAGGFIDLLGDGRVDARDGGGRLFDLDLTYKVQTEPGGIAQVVGMARDFAAGDKLVVCLGDNIFEYAQADAIAGWDSGDRVGLRVLEDVVAEADDELVAGGEVAGHPHDLRDPARLGLDLVGEVEVEESPAAVACVDPSVT